MNNGSFSGDLGSVVQEAYGFTQDCGRSYETDRHVLGYIEQMYDGGTFAFVMDVKPLW